VDKLEIALQQATGELKKRTEMYEKWEFKAGDQQQQISEIERIRKALTVQIHGLRQEIGPKEEKLLLVTEKLQEMESEYGRALKAISEKEVALTQKSASLYMLQKQVRDLRSTSLTKDASLKRAATLFEQYRETLVQAIATSTSGAVGVGSDKTKKNPLNFNDSRNTKLVSTKHKDIKPPPTPQPFEDTVATRKDNELALQRLDDVLRPHLALLVSPVSEDIDPEMASSNESENMAIHAEKEKQVMQLHRNVNALKGNLERAQMLAELHSKNQLSDNELLLKEVNDMRQEIRTLSMDNHRLKADLFQATRIKTKSSNYVSSPPHSVKSNGKDRCTYIIVYTHIYILRII
jgi:hypothetical protein